MDWPLAKVEEVYPGKDGQIRVVKLKTTKGVLIRPIQRLISLEEECPSQEKFLKLIPKNTKTTEESKNVHAEESEPDISTEPELKTKRGRIIKKPQRLDL